MYLCVLSSTPDDPNDKPYDPAPHMNGFHWKHHQVQPKNVEKQIRDLMNEGVDVFFNLCDGTPDDALSGIGLAHSESSRSIRRAADLPSRRMSSPELISR